MNEDIENERTIDAIKKVRDELRQLSREMSKTGSCIPHYDEEGRCIDLWTVSDHLDHDVTAKLQKLISLIQEGIRLRGHMYSRGQRKAAVIKYWRRVKKNPSKYQTR